MGQTDGCTDRRTDGPRYSKMPPPWGGGKKSNTEKLLSENRFNKTCINSFVEIRDTFQTLNLENFPASHRSSKLISTTVGRTARQSTCDGRWLVYHTDRPLFCLAHDTPGVARRAGLSAIAPSSNESVPIQLAQCWFPGLVFPVIKC